MQENIGPSPEEMGLSPNEMEIPDSDEAKEDIEGDHEQTEGELLLDKAEGALLEQMDGIEDDETMKTWTERFKGAFPKMGPATPGRGKMIIGGILATGQAGFATEALMRGSKAEAIMWAALSIAGVGVARKGWKEDTIKHDGVGKNEAQ